MYSNEVTSHDQTENALAAAQKELTALRNNPIQEKQQHAGTTARAITADRTSQQETERADRERVRAQDAERQAIEQEAMHMVTGDNLTTAENQIRDQANAHQRDEELLIAQGRD